MDNLKIESNIRLNTKKKYFILETWTIYIPSANGGVRHRPTRLLINKAFYRRKSAEKYIRKIIKKSNVSIAEYEIFKRNKDETILKFFNNVKTKILLKYL
ncbi:hypothetical protein Bp8pS_074 [Bacillus phage vB_BpuM-BpSp]|nr:hypothetical protein Bp8pS_074 [Bacillus phage vB_BpuM-BpSp]